jgi:hypothetical protein
MAKTLNDNFKISAGRPIDSKYLNQSNTAYTGTSQVFSQIPVPERYLGLTVLVGSQEYWFKNGVSDGSLIQKIATVTNGLTLATNNYVLGGALTGDTKITGAAGTKSLYLGGSTYPFDGDRLNIFGVRSETVDIKSAQASTLHSDTSVTIDGGSASPRLVMNTTTFEFLDRRGIKRGVAYAGDYSSGFTNFSLVHKLWVEDLFNNATGSTFVLATNGLTKSGSYVKLGGTLTGTTLIDANSKSLVLKLSTLPSNAAFLKGDIGSNLNVPIFTIKNSTGQTVSAGKTDIIIGPHTGLTVTTGKTAGNIAIGQNNLAKLKSNVGDFSGDRNIAIGYENLRNMSGSTHNIAIGRKNGLGASGNFNYAVNIGYENGIGATNNANDQHINIGVWNMQNLTAHTGTINMVAIGYGNMGESMCDHGEGSVAIGQDNLKNSKFERYQIVMGNWAGRNAHIGRGNILMGIYAGQGMTGGTSGSTGIGNVQFNVGIGTHTLENGSGNKGTYVGCEAGSSGVRGFGNSGFGVWSMNRARGDYNSGLGGFAGYHVSLYLTGNTNTFVGYKASYSVSTLTNSIVIGNNYNAALSNKIHIGSSTQDTIIVKANSASTSNDVMVRTSTGQIETRKIGSLNQVNVRVVSSHTTSVETDHVLLVTTASSGLTVSLRTTPNDGEVIVIKDRSGNANTRNITINGNGKNIDGSSSAVINTNYGAAKLVYSTSANAWFSIGMII